MANQSLRKWYGLSTDTDMGDGFQGAMERSNQQIAEQTRVGQPVEEYNAQAAASDSAQTGTDAAKAGGGAMMASDPVVGASIMAGATLINGIMEANAKRQQMQMAHYQNQLSSISGGVQQYANQTRAINQDMLAAMGGLA